MSTTIVVSAESEFTGEAPKVDRLASGALVHLHDGEMENLQLLDDDMRDVWSARQRSRAPVGLR